jgi:pimeloyl-ACP methyl ester carboxylesterase
MAVTEAAAEAIGLCRRWPNTYQAMQTLPRFSMLLPPLGTTWRLLASTVAAGMIIRHVRKPAREPVLLACHRFDPPLDAHPVVVVLLHGMWHGVWYWREVQSYLAEQGFSSIAVDLQPASRWRGGTASELVADLELTLTRLDIRGAALVGHSQGGLIAQAFVKDALPRHPELLSSLVLLGTLPLGMAPTKLGLCGMGLIAYYCCMATGRITTGAARRIFLRPGTTSTALGSTIEYIERISSAPPDGLLTMTHFIPPGTHRDESSILVLIVGAAEDDVYPPAVVKAGFDERFPHAAHFVAQGQAHCFVDPGWEEAMCAPLVAWLEGVEPRVFSTGF